MLIAHTCASVGSQLGVASTTLESTGKKRKRGREIVKQGRRTEKGEEQPIIHADTGYGNATANMYVGFCVFVAEGVVAADTCRKLQHQDHHETSEEPADVSSSAWSCLFLPHV